MNLRRLFNGPALAWLMFFLAVPVFSVEYYVAPTGQDANPGTKSAPLASLTGARNAIRAAKESGSTGPWTVIFAEGTYPVSEPVVFGPEDSGTADNPIVYQGIPTATVISGGLEITGWKKEPNSRFWSADLPTIEGRPAYFEQLFVNGRRAVRARFPNNGFLYPEAVKEDFPMDRKTRKLTKPFTPQYMTAKPGELDILKKVPKEELRFAQFIIHHNWVSTRRIILDYNPETRILATQGRPSAAWNPWRNNSPYYIENIRAAFDQPGEWLYDGCAKKVLYYPRKDERIETARIQTARPGLVQLLKLNGSADKKVEHIVFKGLTFAFTDTPRRLPDMKNAALDPAVTGPLDQPGPSQFEPAQAAAYTLSVLEFDNINNIKLTDCQIRNTGEYGLHIKTGSNCLVSKCLFCDLGAGAVRLGGASGTKNVTVENSIMHRGGRFHAAATAVWIGNNVEDCALTHNDIADFYYTGVSVGWTWGYKGGVCFRNKIEFNKIYKIGQGQLADMGGVYTLGTLTGTRVCNNVIHDIQSYGYGGWGLYTDEGSEGVLMENNLVYNTTDGSYHQHYGKNNTIRNNIFVRSAPNPQTGAKRQIAITRVEKHLSITFENNIVYWDGGDAINDAFDKAQTKTRNNIWFDTTGEPKFNGRTHQQWTEKGKDIGGIVADPMFTSPDKNIFRLKKNSPALKVGFKPFDFSKAGVYGDPNWLRRANAK